LYVVLLDRREAEALVLFGVALGADPKEPEVEQPDCAREHSLPVDILPAQVSGHGAPHSGQGAREVEHLVELLLVSPRAPGFVVEILLATRRIDAGGLKMAIGQRADPDVLPGRRDR
jgi:hypothetical protein